MSVPDPPAVQRLRLVYKEGGTLGRNWRLRIGGRDLLDLLDERASVPGQWSERSQALIDIDQLAASLQKPGFYSIVVCAHCLAAGYPSPEDIGLRPIEVLHQGELLIWRLPPPQIGVAENESDPLVLCFHLPQVRRELQARRTQK